MRMTGTGVDGNNVTISSIEPASSTKINVSGSQTISDDTTLTFEVAENKYDITITPIKGLLSTSIPTTTPTYSVYQYMDPIIEIAPSTANGSITLTGTVSLRGYASGSAPSNLSNYNRTNTLTINMTATHSSNDLAVDRQPRFSNQDSTLSDFSNSISNVTKKVQHDCAEAFSDIPLNNITDIRVGMIVIGKGIVGDRVTVKSITDLLLSYLQNKSFQKTQI